jgi:hypothetical protein
MKILRANEASIHYEIEMDYGYSMEMIPWEDNPTLTLKARINEYQLMEFTPSSSHIQRTTTLTFRNTATHLGNHHTRMSSQTRKDVPNRHHET